MSEAGNIALYRRLIDDGVGIGRLCTLDEVLAPGIELPTVAPAAEPTLAGLKAPHCRAAAGHRPARTDGAAVPVSGDLVVAWLVAQR